MTTVGRNLMSICGPIPLSVSNQLEKTTPKNSNEPQPKTVARLFSKTVENYLK